jgi:DNA invertase Pin-like site-specific DNA recombinase
MGEQTMDRTRDRIAREKQRAKEQDRKEKQQMKQKHDSMLDRARRQRMLQKNRGVSEQINEASFEDKSKASGISVGTLKKVYQRGVAAWKTGHRPGTTPQQWGHARVNAFIKKKKTGGLNHDKDLA